MKPLCKGRLFAMFWKKHLAECSKLRRAIWIECQPKKWDIAYARQHGIKVLANIEAALAE